jgi:hypothetical protein
MRSAGSWIACLAVLLAGPAAMAGVTVDGNLGDWGVTAGSGDSLVFGSSIVNATTLGGGKGSVPDFLGSGSGVVMYYQAEDLVGSGGRVGPDYGGQNYDAEFMGVFVDDCKLYIAVASGQRPDNGLSQFGPGDIRVEATLNPAGGGTESHVFGIEVGGGPGTGTAYNAYYGGSPPASIAEGAPGTTYDLNGNGYTVGLYTSDHTGLLGSDGVLPVSQHNAGQLAGTVWLTDNAGDWINDPIAPPSPTQFQLQSGTEVGTADYVFNFGTGIGEHSFIELCLDLAALGFSAGTEGSLSVKWRPACGNDELLPEALTVSCPIEPPPSVVPEPASLLVWAALVLVVAGGWTWRRRKTLASRP